MTTDSVWEATKWRADEYRGPYDGMPTPQTSASSTVTRTPHSGILDAYTPAWHGHELKCRANSDPQARELPPTNEAYTDTASYHSRNQDRNEPSTEGNHGPERLIGFSEETPTWHNPTFDRDGRANERHITDPPLTLQIPNSQGKYKTFRR